MGNIKAKSQLEKLGFSDGDKKSSEHDDIQIWVYENIEKIISETVMSKNKFPYKILEKKWEHQVLNVNYGYQNREFKSIIGYIDLLVRVKGKFYFRGIDEPQSEDINVFIEVKTKIPSIGDLIRQMRAYQTFESSSTKYIVVSPDDRFSEILKEQGFWFYKYKNPNMLF